MEINTTINTNTNINVNVNTNINKNTNINTNVNTNTNIETYKKDRFYQIAFIVIALLITLYPLLKVQFTTMDDMELYLFHTAKDVNIIADTIDAAKSQGRIMFIPSAVLLSICYLLDNFYYYKFIVFASLAMNIMLFGYLIKMVFKSTNFALAAVFFFIFPLQFSWEHNLVTSYPFLFQFAVSCYIASIILLIKYINDRRKRWIIAGAVFYALALVAYEMYVLYVVVYIVIAALYKYKKDNTLLQNIREISSVVYPYCIVTLGYMALYFSFRFAYPSTYDGNQIGKFSLYGFLRVVYQYSVASVPTYISRRYVDFFVQYADTFDKNPREFINIIKYARVEWIIKSLVSAIFFYSILDYKKVILNKLKYLACVFLSIMLYIIPVLLPALTKKYQDWVIDFNSIAYTITYYSFFGVILFSISTMFYFNGLIKKNIVRRIFIIGVCVVAAYVSIVTDFSNYYVAKSQTLSNFKWKTVDLFIETEEFKELPEGSVIYAPSLWKSIGIAAINDTYWSRYTLHKTGKDVTFTNDASLINRIDKDKLYFLKYVQESKDTNQYLIFSKIKSIKPTVNQREYLYSNKAKIFSYSKYKQFAVYFESPEAKSSPVYSDEKLLAYNEKGPFMYKVDLNASRDIMVSTTIETEVIDLNSILLSNFYDVY